LADRLDDDFSPLFRESLATMDRASWGAIVQRTQRKVPETPDDVRALIHRIAPEEGVDPYLMEAMMARESGGDPHAVSPKNAQGLMQLIPATAQRFGVRDPFDPEQNIRGSAKYLAFLKGEFPGRIDLQLAAYNAGEGAVRKYGNTIPPYPETQAYVPAIQAQYRALRHIPLSVTFPPQANPHGPLGARFTPADQGAPDDPARVAASVQALPPRMASDLTTIPPPPAGVTEPGLDTDLLGSREPTQALGDLGRQLRDSITTLYHGPTAPGPTERAAPLESTPSPDRPGAEGGPPLAVTFPAHPPLQATFPPVDQAAQENPARIAASVQGLPPRMAPDLTPYVPFTKLEPGLVEDRVGRTLGSIGQGTLQLYHGLLRSLVAAQHLAGLPKIPVSDRPDGIDPMGAALLDPVFTRLEKAIEPRVGEQGPDFVDKLAHGIGTSLGSLLPAAGVGRFLEGLATVAPRVARGGAALTGGVLEGAGEAGDLYTNLVPLVGEDEAANRALKSFAANVVLVTVTDKYGIFGESGSLLRKTLNGIVTNGLQEVVQYDIERRGFVVPADHPQAATLKLQGWQEQGGVLFKPFVLKEAAEVAAIGAIIGGPAAAMVHLAAEQQVPAVRELVAQERAQVAPTIPDTLVKGPDGLPLRVYHGTAAAFESFDLSKADESGLYGPGLYFTDTPAVAKGYATAGWPDAARQAFEDMERAQRSRAYYEMQASQAPETSVDALQAQDRAASYGAQEQEAQQRLAQEQAAHPEIFEEHPNVRPAYLDITQPFDIDAVVAPETAQALLRAVNHPIASVETNLQQYTGSGLTGKVLYTVLARQAGGKAAANQALQQAGFDGITHTGGAVTGGQPHQVYIAFDPAQVHPAFGIEAALQAAESPEVPPPGIEPSTWQRWGRAVSSLLTSERGSTGAPGQQPVRLPGDILRTLDRIQADMEALDAGGEAQQEVLQRLGVPSLTAASMRLAAEAQQAQAAAQTTPEPPAAAPLALAGPPLRAGAEGLTPERYRTPAGAWRVPLRDIPSQELELQDLIRQQGGITLTNEELQGELAGVISRKETGLSGLQNTTSGLSLQHMAEIAQQHGFTPTADKESLLEALDRSVTQGHPVYSVQATGRINLLDDPHVQGAYQAVLDAVDALGPATAAQVAGVRHRRDVHTEAQELIDTGQFTLDDVRELFPNQSLNDTMASALLQSMYTVGQQVGAAAQAYLASGGRVGSREEASLQETMALMAELDPYRLGVSAAQSRGLGILNDPLSAYTAYLNRLHQVLTDAPERTMRQIATKIAAAHQQAEAATTPKDQAYWQAHPEELAALFAEMHTLIAEWTGLPSGLQEQLPLLPEEQASFISALDLLPPEDRARARDELDTLLQSWATAQTLTTEQARDEARADALRQWTVLRAEVEALHTARTRRGSQSPPGGPPLELTADAEQGTFAELARSPEEQALIDAAYTPGGPGRTREEILTIDRQRRELQANREHFAADQQWQADLEAFRALETAWRAGTTRYALTSDEAVQEARDLQQQIADAADATPALTPGMIDILMGRNLTAEEVALLARLDRAVHPWRQRDQQLPMAKVLAQQARPGFQDYFLELWYNAMLSNPATHLANLMSNAAVTVMTIPERFLAEQYSRAAGTTGELGTGVQPGEAQAMLYGLTHGLADAWAVAARSFKQGSPLSGLSKEWVRAPVVTAQNLGLDQDSALGHAVNFWFEYIGLASGGRLPTRALMAADEFFKSLLYSTELNALAYREAARLGYEGRVFAEHVHRVITSPSLGQMQEAAGSFAVLGTFQQTLAPDSVGGQLQRLVNTPWRIPGTGGGTFPVARLLVPYIQTPLNIARHAAERTPLGLFFASVQEDLAAGGAREQLVRGKLAMGAITMTALAGLALAGRLVGRGPEDPDLRALWLRQHPEYSVQLPGGRWVSLDRFEPLGMFVGMVGDTMQLAGDMSIPELDRAVAAAYYPFMKNIVSKTWFRGLSDFFDAMSPRPWSRGDHVMEQALRFGSRQVASLAQPSSLMNATARVFDPAEKDARGILDAIAARIPGMRATVPSRRTLGGEKYLLGVGMAEDMLANTVRAYVPMRMGVDDLSPADREILAHQMRLSPPPRHLASYGTRPGEQAQSHTQVDVATLPRLTLTVQQYEKYAVLAGGNQEEARKLGVPIPDKALRDLVKELSPGLGARPPAGVLGLDAYLNWLVTTPAYQKATPGRDGGKEESIREAVLAYREMGRDLLLESDDALRQQYEETHILRESLKVPLEQREKDQRSQRQGYARERTQRRKAMGLPPAVPQGLGVSP
jgi:hypothetical protein